MKPGIVISVEQATALPYATQRFVQHGWRVIRVESAGDAGRAGDPNRYIGHDVGAGPDRRAAFIAPNVGKESVALNLKSEAGRSLLRRMLATLRADVFCCNVLPKHYAALGIDYDTLRGAKPDLIWAGISALGPDYPAVAGYDPIVQAMSGLMSLNGDPAGSPTLIGVPLTDLKAGDELYAGVLVGLLERAQTGAGKRIDISMVQAAMSLLPTVLPLVDLGGPPNVLTRSGNAHRQFVPTNVYALSDGHLYLAIGSDAQWRKLLSIDGFAVLDVEAFATLDKRTENRYGLYKALGDITAKWTVASLSERLTALSLPHSMINSVQQAMALPAIAPKLGQTEVGGLRVRLPPPASDIAMPAVVSEAPRYGEHTDAILREIGASDAETAAWRNEGAIA